MPKLWSDTIEEHRRTVRDAIMEITVALVGEQGLRAVTMSRIAEQAGIGRATLYKYFPDVDAILTAWHERQVAGHLAELTSLRDGPGGPVERLEAMLSAYARMRHEDQGTELAALLHGGEHVAHAQQHVLDLVRSLISEGAEAGELRRDVPPRELATYCLYALAAAGSLPSKAAIRRLVAVTIAGLYPPAA